MIPSSNKLKFTVSSPGQHELKSILMELLQAVDMKASEAAPSSGAQAASHGTQVVVALLTATRRAFRAVSLLLNTNLAEEARIIGRTLAQDAATLGYLHRHSEDLESLALRAVYQSTRQLLGIEQLAEHLGLRRPLGRIGRLQQDMHEIQTLASENNVQLKKLPDVNSMLRELGAGKLYWFYQADSTYVHSSVHALGSRLDWSTDVIRIKLESEIPDLIHIGARAAESFQTALIAGAILLEWGTEQELAQFRLTARAGFQKLLERAADIRGVSPEQSPEFDNPEG